MKTMLLMTSFLLSMMLTISLMNITLVNAQWINTINSIAYVDSYYHNNKFDLDNDNSKQLLSNNWSYNMLKLPNSESIIYIVLVTLIILIMLSISITTIYKHAEKKLYEE